MGKKVQTIRVYTPEQRRRIDQYAEQVALAGFEEFYQEQESVDAVSHDARQRVKSAIDFAVRNGWAEPCPGPLKRYLVSDDLDGTWAEYDDVAQAEVAHAALQIVAGDRYVLRVVDVES